MPYRKVGALEDCWYMIRYKLKETFMPRIPDHPCSHPGCPRLVPRGRKYCNEHAGLHPEEVRSAFSPWLRPEVAEGIKGFPSQPSAVR